MRVLDENRDSTSLEVFCAFEIREFVLLSDAFAMCELLVGLPGVNVLGVTNIDGRLRVLVERKGPRPSRPGCGSGQRLS